MRIIFCLTYSQHFGKENSDTHLKESDFLFETSFYEYSLGCPQIVSNPPQTHCRAGQVICEKTSRRDFRRQALSKWFHRNLNIFYTVPGSAGGETTFMFIL